MKKSSKQSYYKKATSKKKLPPVRKDPRIFEVAFFARIEQTPVEFLMEKIKAGSDKESTRYLFDIMSAEIARLNNCICLGFDHYYAIASNEVKRMEQRRKVTVYNKLVRDNISEIITSTGKKCTTEILSREVYIRMLDEKLNEELAEYQQSKSLEELGDLLEVMGAVVKARGFTWDDLTRVRKEKRAKHGGFDKRILLKEVVEE